MSASSCHFPSILPFFTSTLSPPKPSHCISFSSLVFQNMMCPQNFLSDSLFIVRRQITLRTQTAVSASPAFPLPPPHKPNYKRNQEQETNCHACGYGYEG